jgi:hypothetical protein
MLTAGGAQVSIGGTGANSKAALTVASSPSKYITGLSGYYIDDLKALVFNFSDASTVGECRYSQAEASLVSPRSHSLTII